ncbi:hypothetical protein CRENBAI_025559 [Crenichthys baileyi]|uniref:Uncharacterized protein n=1 Tax=Crenichthys baileyi TaxID=28760 RepID=A0AAV9RAF1_9TELE
MTVSQTVTLGTSHYQDQADRLKELKKWEREQEKELKKMYGEEVEIVPSPLLLQEKEEAEGRQPTPVSPVSIPGRIRSSFPPTVSATSTSSRRRRHRHKPPSSPTAREPSTSAAAPVRPLSSAATPAAADSPADSRKTSSPKNRRHWRGSDRRFQPYIGGPVRHGLCAAVGWSSAPLLSPPSVATPAQNMAGAISKPGVKVKRGP